MISSGRDDRVGMFTRHRLGPTNKLDCLHAMGTNAFSRIMIPRLPLRLRSGLRQRRDFGSGLRRPLGASTFWCYHRPIRLFRCAQSLRAGSGCLPRTQATNLRVSLGARAAQFQAHVYGYVVMPEHVRSLRSLFRRISSFSIQKGSRAEALSKARWSL